MRQCGLDRASLSLQSSPPSPSLSPSLDGAGKHGRRYKCDRNIRFFYTFLCFVIAPLTRWERHFVSNVITQSDRSFSNQTRWKGHQRPWQKAICPTVLPTHQGRTCKGSKQCWDICQLSINIAVIENLSNIFGDTCVTFMLWTRPITQNS